MSLVRRSEGREVLLRGGEAHPIRATRHRRIAEGGAPGALLVQARLANDVVLSWTQDGQNAHAQANLVHTLAGLPCFA